LRGSYSGADRRQQLIGREAETDRAAADREVWFRDGNKRYSIIYKMIGRDHLIERCDQKNRTVFDSDVLREYTAIFDPHYQQFTAGILLKHKLATNIRPGMPS